MSFLLLFLNIVQYVNVIRTYLTLISKLHFTLLNNEMLSECLSSLNLQAKKESISKRWRKDLVLELVQRSQITPLDESSTELVSASD